MVRSTLPFGIGRSGSSSGGGGGAGTYSIGSGGTYADLNAALAAALLTPSDINSSGLQQRDIHFQITAAGMTVSNSFQNLEGWNPNGFKLYIEPAPGAAWQSGYSIANPLNPATQYGASLILNGTSTIWVGTGTTMAVVFRNLQIFNTGKFGNGSNYGPIVGIGNVLSGSTFEFDNNLFYWDGNSHYAPAIGWGWYPSGQDTSIEANVTFITRNNIIYGLEAVDNIGMLIYATGGGPGGGPLSNHYNNLILKQGTTGGLGLQVSNGLSNIKNNSFCNYYYASSPDDITISYDTYGSYPNVSNNATSGPSFNDSRLTTNQLLNATAALCFNSPTITSTDLRLTSGSPLKGAGVLDAVNNPTDILGRTRSSPDCIGPWAS